MSMESLPAATPRATTTPAAPLPPAIDFAGIWLPLVTPFREGRVDVAALKRLVSDARAQGVAGFVPCGSTGEAAMLDDDEQATVLAATLDAAGARPVIMGVSGVRADALGARLRNMAAQHPAVAAFLIAPPSYVRPSQAALTVWYHHLAEASPRPVVAYDIPARTGVRIEAATLLAIAEHPRIVAVKDCSGDRHAAHAIIDHGGLALLAGNDDELFDQLARGATGGVCASAHVHTHAFVELHRLIASGLLREARARWRELRPWISACFDEPNPAPVKAALAWQDRIADELRAPMQAISIEGRRRLSAVLQGLQADRQGQPPAA